MKKIVDIMTKAIDKLNDLKEDCETCGGKGYGYWSCCNQELVDEDIARCPICQENLGEEDCEDCNGTGKANG